MTSPLEKTYVEVVALTDNFEKDLDKKSDKAFDKVDDRADDTAEHIIEVFKKAGTSISTSISSSTSGVEKAKAAIVSLGNEGSRSNEKLKNSADDTEFSFSKLFKLIVGREGIFGRLLRGGPEGLSSISAAFLVLISSITIAARVAQDFIAIISFGLAGIPGLITGVIASFFVLRAAFSGIGAAYKELTEKQNKAGASGVSNARQVADAQRGVLQAQKDLIKAKEDEIDRIRELSIQLQRARATEARAADDVLKAEYALQRAREVGTPRSQIEAQLALDEAKASLAEAKEETKDLSAEKAKADKNGVNGSEAVLRAQEALIDAQDRLAQAQNVASAGIASQTKAFDGLTKSAQEFVLALVSAREQLGPVQDAIQEAFFAGTGPLIQPIVDSIKELQPELVDVAAGFGDIFKEILTFLGTPEAKEALRSVLAGVSEFLKAIKPAIGPLLKAFAALVGDSGELGKTLGEKVAIALTKIADFVSKVDIEQLFKDAKDAVKELTPFLTNLFSIFQSLFRILAFVGEFILPSFTLGLFAIASAFDFIDAAIAKVRKTLDPLVKEAFEEVKRLSQTFIEIPGKIKNLGAKFLEAGKFIIEKLFAGISSAGGFASDFAKNLANTFVRFFNNTVIASINKGVKLIQDGINKIPGLSLSLPKLSNIPALEGGGLLTSDSIFRGGEKGRKEAVLPLENSRVMGMIGKAISDAGGVGGQGGITFAPGAIVLQFSGSAPTPAVARNIGEAIARSTATALERRNIRTNIRSL